MNAIVYEPVKQGQVVVLLPVEDPIELEWVNVLDCGALGPSHEEAALFYQGIQEGEAD